MGFFQQMFLKKQITSIKQFLLCILAFFSSSFRQKLAKFCLSTKLKQQGHEICTVVITGLFLLSQPEMNKAKRVCVIGAGPSGMSALYQFKQLEMKGQEIPEIVCFEKQSDWGGLWKYSWRTGKVAIAFCRDLRWLKLSFAQGACRDFSFI